jgi:S1-C subfamily serine protease
MKLRDAYTDHAPAMVRITITSQDGNLATGSGFHIGNGVIATARHVLDRGQIHEIVSERGFQPIEIQAVHFHKNPNVDLAVLQTNLNLDHYMTKVTFANDDRRNAAKTDHIPLGGHLDDWIGDEFVLSRVLVMGYPRIPLWNCTGLVAATGEVTAVVDRIDIPHPHFALSYLPRGGFSGGPVISERGFLLGVVTSSLTDGEQPTELGFGVAVSVEPLLSLLAEAGLRPTDVSDEIWNLFSDQA